MLTGRRCGVVGHPVAHSLSPAMHRGAYDALGLDWEYDAADVAPGGLAGHVSGLDARWRGLSVTAPHKRDALALADECDDVARRVGGANTLLLDDAVRAVNTDVPGTVAALRERGVEAPERVRIVGGGATAASVAAAVASMGAARLELVAREPARAEQARAVAVDHGLHVDVLPLGGADGPLDVVDLLVSTVPTAAVARHAERLVATAGAVFDVVYDPWPTPLSTAAETVGTPVVTGLDLLAHQAVLQVRLMTGGDVPADLLRTTALATLVSR